MENLKEVGIREFRENLASHLEGSSPVAVTRHGETIGYYFPVRRKRTEEEKAALWEAKSRLDEIMAAKGITEDDIIEDFERLRGKRK